MDRLISCEFNMDNACVELKFLDGSMIAIDTIAVEFKVNNERAVQFRNPRSIQIFWYDLTSRRMEVSYG